jgi:type II secretory pathway pseudopilin PulG
MSLTGKKGRTRRWALGVGGSDRLPTPNAQRPTPSGAGFTLIELMVVLVGLVIVAAAVVPAMRGAGHRGDLDSAATKVVASARFAREAAVERQETVGLTVEPEPPMVRLVTEQELQSAPSRLQDQAPLAPLPVADALVRLPAGVMAHLEPLPDEPTGAAPVPGAALADGMLRFTPDGRTTGGVVVLADEQGRQRRVHVASETGVVRVEDGNAQ